MISVTILVQDGERHLKNVLASLKDFPEVLILDTGSKDASREIASLFPNVRLIEASFTGFGPSHNHASSLAKNDWILSIDADEVVSKELAKEILSLPLSPENVYSLPFHNYYNGKWIRHCGWYPEHHVRLYHRKQTAFSNVQLHEGVMTKGMKRIRLKNPVNHYSYNSVSDFLIKMERYSNLFVEQHLHKKRSSPLKAWVHGSTAFLKSYFLKRGFLSGYEGLLISAYQGHTAFYKYLKLYQANQKCSSR